MNYEDVLSILKEIKSRLQTLSAEADDREVPVAKRRLEDEREDTFSRVKVVSPKEDMQKSENMTAKALEEFTADSIAARYRKKWAKLDTLMKRDRLATFAKTLKDPAEAEVFLLQHYFETKKIRPKDIDYDEFRGNIDSIPALVTENGDLKIVRPKTVKDPALVEANSSSKPAKLKPAVSALSKKLNARRV